MARDTNETQMNTSIIAAGAVAVLAAGSASPAFAGPYVNIESNSGFAGSDYASTVLETHLGFEGTLGDKAGYYVQGGPALSFVDGEDDSTTELSGKAGLNVAVSDNVSAYGEVALATTGEIDFDEDLNANVKAGLTYRF